MVFTAAAALTSEAGMSPRRATYFLWPESRQRACPCSPRPLRCASGQAAPAPCSCCAAELPARLRRSGQTTAAKVMTVRLHFACSRAQAQGAVAAVVKRGGGRIRVRDSFAVLLIAAAALAERRRGILDRIFGRPDTDNSDCYASDSCLSASSMPWRHISSQLSPAVRSRLPPQRSEGAQTAGDSFFASLLGCAKREVARRGEIPASEVKAAAVSEVSS